MALGHTYASACGEGDAIPVLAIGFLWEVKHPLYAPFPQPQPQRCFAIIIFSPPQPLNTEFQNQFQFLN